MRQLTGKYGRWTVLGFHGRDHRGKDLWDCVCDCGTHKVVRGDQLQCGATRSCGCLSREVAVETARKTGKANAKHGGEKTRLYRVWRKMIDRCHNPHHIAYASYGGRGIGVCAAWRHDFSAFRDWALAHGYADNLSIDRINNDGGYAPENCRWASPAEQARNRRNNKKIDGRCIADWAKGAAVTVSAIHRRLRKGWTIRQAVATPAGEAPHD